MRGSKKQEKGLLMCSDSVICVKGVSKHFQIYEKPSDRLKQFIVPRLQRLMGIKPHFYFSTFKALNSVSFSVSKGETVGIVGRNGAGKSTLLQIICGTLFPTTGEVSIRGRVAALLELGAGFNLEYTGLENVYLNAALLGVAREAVDHKLQEILKFADIGEFIHQPIKTYSSGMVVRLAFAVAISVDPDILIIDEALAVGDELFQRKCFAKIEEIKARGTTILFVSHSGAAVVGLCDRAILIDAGELLLEGQPKEVVGLHHKLMFASDESKESIRQSIKLSGENFAEHSNLASQPSAVSQTQEPGEAYLESFDPELRSESYLEYEQQGARIFEPALVKRGIGPVNNLVRGGHYCYQFKVQFTQDCSSVRCGMLIKTVTGIELGGATTAKDLSSTIDLVKAGEEILVSFVFECNLAPGTYFINAGASGVLGGQMVYLHRVVDALSFRVLPEVRSQMTGIVDFKVSPSISREI